MKKICKTLIIIAAIYATSVRAEEDPFNNTWHYGNYKLTVNAHTPMPGGYDHSISYTQPNGGPSVSSDVCATMNNNTLRCITGDTVVLNQAAHSVLLNNQFTYYEKGYEPKPSPLSGFWQTNSTGCYVLTISIPYADNNAASFPGVKRTFWGGFQIDDFSLYNNPHSQALYVGFQNDVYSDYYLYDDQGQPITDRNNLSKLTVLKSMLDHCVYMKS